MELLINENTFSAIFWTALTFGILVTVLAVYGWPKILEALQEREKRIDDAIRSAEERNREAEEIQARYLAQLEEARVEARKIIEEGKKDALVLKDRLRDEGKKEKEAELNRARREIGLAKDKALSELHQAVGDLSLSIASQILEKELSARDHRKLIEKALKETETAAREG